MGGVREVLPFSKSIIIGCAIGLCGLPFMSAFYSKEIIIESLLINNFSFMPYFVIILGILIIIFYSMRFIILTIRGLHDSALY
jgi:NADH-ubiquinone oxidoreductase chain 5